MSIASIQSWLSEKPSEADVQSTISIISETPDRTKLKAELAPLVQQYYRSYTDRAAPMKMASSTGCQQKLRAIGFKRFVSSLQPDNNAFMTGEPSEARSKAWEAIGEALAKITLSSDSRRGQAQLMAASQGRTGIPAWSATGNSVESLTSAQAADKMADSLAYLGHLTLEEMKVYERKMSV